MDKNIRTLLTVAAKCEGTQAVNSLQKAFDLIQTVTRGHQAEDGPEAFGQDLFVICAEAAFQHGKTEMIKECLKMYFMKTPATNQFLCRAYLCQAQLLAPTTAQNVEQLEKAVVYLIKAISLAKDNPRYHFLVYNASVLYWQFCRPFLKPSYRQHLARSLHQVVKALDDIDDSDYEWRAQLMIALIECHMDAGRKQDASHIASAAASFIKQNVPSLYKTVFGLMVRHQLVESEKFRKDIRTSAELNVFYRICRLKGALDTNDTERDPVEEMKKILNILTGAEEQTKTDRKEKSMERSGRRSATPEDSSDTDIADTGSDTVVGADIEDDLETAAESDNDSTKPSTQDAPDTGDSDLNQACNVEECDLRVADKSSDSLTPADGDGQISAAKKPSGAKARTRTPSPPGFHKSRGTADRPYLLLELGRLALDQDMSDITQQCVSAIREHAGLVQEQSFFLELEFMQCDLLVKALKEKQHSYNPNVVELRVQAIKRCDEAIINALRMSSPKVLQAGCVTQWNLCLPLLQNNLRHLCRRPLATVAEALENIQSLLIQLRCQVHLELAKCEEDQEQIQVAIDNIKKAQSLDDGGVYGERLAVSLRRLELRAELYQQPERSEDQAAMIIEQARVADSGTMRMKRSLLVRAGQGLAPDAFLLVLDSENDIKDAVKGTNALKKLVGKAQHFKRCVKKAEGHLRRLGTENDRERSRLWGDLAKTARKQEVWDVCRVATRFCLLYDDNRWRSESPVRETKRSKSQDREPVVETAEGERPLTEMVRERSTVSRKGEAVRGGSPDRGVPLYDRDLIRMMAEVNFINGESLIHLLRSEGVELGDNPIPPTDKRKHPKGYVPKKPEDDPDWIEYSEWITSLSKDAVKAFLRAAELGVSLREPWIVCSAATYVWNYNNHVLSQNRHKEIVEVLQTLLAAFKKVGHAGETTLLVNLCNALATGLVQPWLPAVEPKALVVAEQPSVPGKESPKRGRAPQPAASKPKGAASVSIPSDATPDLKKAVEVCDYALKITNGDNKQDVVAIATRYPLLQMWVCARQMAQQQISKNLGTDDDSSTEGQKPMTRAIVGVEMLLLNGNGIMEFKECPSLPQAVDMISGSVWTDKLVELQLWTRLAYLALEKKDHSTVTTCAKHAAGFAERGTQPANQKPDSHKYLVEQEMLSISASIHGQSLIRNTQGKNSIRRKAMSQFIDSARFARNAKNYDLVINAARHYWNASMSLVSQPLERELLNKPLTVLLQCITDTTDKNMYKKREEEEEEGEGEVTPRLAIPPVQSSTEAQADGPATGNQGDTDPGNTSAAENTVPGSPEDDLTLRAALYGVLFQSYADKGEWDAGLKAMEQAINDMPRTNHRLLIFKHLVVVKAKLGLDVSMSIQKFKDEREDYVAQMWRRVALSSKDTREQLQAYQNAIEALSSPWTDWQKVDYLLELAQWLYCKEFPLQDALDQLDWAIDLLLNMKFQVEQQKRDTESEDEEVVVKVKGKRSKSKGRKTPPPSSAKSDKKAAAKKLPEKKAAKDAGKGKKAKVEERASSKATTRTEQSEPEAASTDIVPVQKEVAIGALPSNPALTLSDLSNVQQLEGLFRAYTIKAQMVGRSSPHYADYCLMAYGYIQRIWQVSLGHCGPVLKEIARQQALEAAENTGKNSSKGKPKGKDQKEEKKEKPKRKGPLDHLPTSVDEWAGYNAPDEVIDAFKHRLMAQTGINTTTMLKPTLTLLYLDMLTSKLRELGYNHLALPVLAMSDAMTHDVVNDRSLNALVHLRAMEVCVELNHNSGVQFHEKLAHYRINEDEQAKAHEEMAIWREKQLQVAKEEQRIKSALAHSKEQGCKVMTQRDKELLQKLKEMEDNKEPSHLGTEIGAVKQHQVWADTADVLLANGIYQPARELLNEAHTIAQAFSDKPLEARILYLLGKLSYHEAQYRQAINFCNQAQATFDGDEMFWYETTMLIVDATMNDFSRKEKKKYRTARGQLIHALNVFLDVTAMYPNKNSVNGYIVARLEAKLAQVQIKLTLSEHDNILKTKVMASLNSSCKKLRHAFSQLVELGYHREALEILQFQASLYVDIARITPMNEDKHEYYVQALSLHREAVQIGSELLHDVQSLGTLMEMRCVSTPVQRETLEARLSCAELMLEIQRLHVQEERARALDRQSKGAVLRAVEDLVRGTPDHTSSEREWLHITRVLGEEMLTLLCAAHSMSGNILDLKARCVTGIGRCLRQVGLHSSPDEPLHWKLQDMEVLRLGDHTKGAPVSSRMDVSHTEGSVAEDNHEDAEEEAEEEELDTSSKEYINLLQEITAKKTSLEISHSSMAQANEVLTQALNLSLSKGLLETAAAASLELVEVYGQFDPALATQYLAMHQSCQASLYLESLLTRALYDPQVSQSAALVHQRSNLRAARSRTNATHSPVMKTLTTALQDSSMAWQRLNVSAHHMDFLKEFPNNFNFIVLQHSPDKYRLYGAILDKPKPSGGGKGSQKSTSLAATSKAKVVSMETCPKKLDDLLQRFCWYKHEMMQMLLKFEYQRSLMAQKEKMLSTLDSSEQAELSESPQAKEWAQDEQRLHDKFLELLEDMATYLQPITSQIESQFRPPSATTSETTKTRGGGTQKEEQPQDYYILLTDQYLQELPLEALSCFQTDNIVSLTRDISLQMLYHKFYVEPLDEAAEKAKKEKEKNKPPSRIPGLRDASKKLAKIIPLDRPVSPGFMPVDTHAFRYICDPYLDSSQTEEMKPVDQLAKVLEEHVQQFTPRWLGVAGNDHTPSLGEYEIYMNEGSGFVFYGMERFLCHLPPHKVAALNLPDCQFAMLLDMAQTNSSFSRQAKLDVHKTADVLSLEKPTEAAMLLSLAGAKCVCLNQWHCSLTENGLRLETFMRDFLEKGKSSGQSAHYQLNPNKRREDEFAEQQALLETEQAKAGGKNQSSEEGAEEEAREPPQPLSMGRAWYNMVCYGLPNLIVTQIGKP